MADPATCVPNIMMIMTTRTQLTTPKLGFVGILLDDYNLEEVWKVCVARYSADLQGTELNKRNG